MNKEWQSDLIRLIQECRAINHGQRFGQLLYNEIALHDRDNDRLGEGYNEDFHSRLFYITDEELVSLLKGLTA